MLTCTLITHENEMKNKKNRYTENQKDFKSQNNESHYRKDTTRVADSEMKTKKLNAQKTQICYCVQKAF